MCAHDDGWKYHPKHVEQFPDINKLCNVASCWIYIGIYRLENWEVDKKNNRKHGKSIENPVNEFDQI